MKTLILLRHGESEWNKLNLFTGWTDVELSEKGECEAKLAGKLIKEEGLKPSICFTSLLKRAIHTLNFALDNMDMNYLPVIKDYRLNERHYGALQGLNKSETAEKYGEEQVKIWRRSYDVCPPALTEDDPRNPANQEAYKGIDKKNLPLTESLEITVARVVPFFNEEVKPHLDNGETVLIAAHGNSLRALVMYLKGLTKEEVLGLNIPTGVPLVLHLDDSDKVLDEKYLGNQDEIAAKQAAVANQGKKA